MAADGRHPGLPRCSFSPVPFPSSPPYPSPDPRSPQRDSVQAAHQLTSTYLDTKASMLGIVEEGLKLKLEIQSIRHQFISLIDNFEDFDKMKPTLAIPSLAVAGGATSSPSAAAASPHHGTKKTVSGARARVRALYDARKARILARRAGASLLKTATSSPGGPSSSLVKPVTLLPMAKSTLPFVEGPRASYGIQDDFEDKENIHVIPNNTVSRKMTSTPATVSAPVCGFDGARVPPPHVPLWNTNKFLTPIKEETPVVERWRGHTKRGSPYVPNDRKSALVIAARNSRRTRSPLTDIEGEYVRLRSPSPRTDEYMLMTSPAFRLPNVGDIQASCERSETDMDISSPKCGVTTRASPERSMTCSNSPSPVKYATSDTISELYTSKHIKDLSQIADTSRTMLREQPSSGNLSGAFHSTFNYPLHSTLNYPLSSTFNMSSVESEELTPPSKKEETTISESSLAVRATSSNKLSLARSRDDTLTMTLQKRSSKRSSMSSYCSSNKARRASSSASSSTSSSSSSSSSAARKIMRAATLKVINSPSSFKTPTKKPQATLCKEHGLHPTFGGPCIFQDDNDSFIMTDTSPEEENNNIHRGKSHAGAPARRGAYAETDCDSSYLSECIEDNHFNQGYGDAEDYTATYDSRNARMRMLRRQTGHTDIKQARVPIGMSESDLFFDVTQKHLSLEATRSSLPDLSGLSTLPSEVDDDVSESTLHATPQKGQLSLNSSHRDSDEMNSTLTSLGHHQQQQQQQQKNKQQRPLSVATTVTTDESPESNTGLTVPVNSPNITDSGGSSSRPTTDNYDYVDVPAKIDPKITARLRPMGCLPIALPKLSSKTRPVTMGHGAGSQVTAPTSQSTHQGSHHHHQYKRKVTSQVLTSGAPTSGSHETKSVRSTGCISKSRHSREWDSGCSTHSSKWTSRTTPTPVPDTSYPPHHLSNSHHGSHHGSHFTINDNSGMQRTVVQHSAVARHLPKDRKKQLVKKLKRFNSNFQRATSTENLQIQTLGHF